MPIRPRPSTRQRLAALVAAVALVLTLAPTATAAQERNAFARGAAITFDAVIVRPLRATAVLIGAACFVPAAIVSSPGGSNAIGHAWDKLVQHPVDLAFRKPLGEF